MEGLEEKNGESQVTMESTNNAERSKWQAMFTPNVIGVIAVAVIAIGVGIWKQSDKGNEETASGSQANSYEQNLDRPQQIAKNFRAQMMQGSICETVANNIDSIANNGMPENVRYMAITSAVQSASRAGCL
jgi:hypothetical protein